MHLDVSEQLRQLNCDPIAGMARLAQDDNLPPALRARMFAELATYIVPRRKAVEVSGPNGTPIEIEPTCDFSSLSIDELRTLMTLLRKAQSG